jgi:hypothetical protein
MARTAKQAAASRANLVKARAKRSSASSSEHPMVAHSPGKFTQNLAERKKQTAKWVASGSLPASTRQRRQERVGGRSWAANEAGGSYLPGTAFKKGSRRRASGETGAHFTQSRKQAIAGVRVVGGKTYTHNKRVTKKEIAASQAWRKRNR